MFISKYVHKYRKFVVAGVVVAVLVVGGVVALASSSNAHKLTVMPIKATSTPTNSPAVQGDATSVSTPTPTPAPTHSVAPVTSAGTQAMSKRIVAAAPRVFTPVIPMTSTVPTQDPTSPSATPAATPLPATLQWFSQYGGFFDSIYKTFNQMGVDANDNDITAIASDCQTIGTYAQQGLSVPPVPVASLNQQMDSDLNSLLGGTQVCVSGINNNDQTLAVNGIQSMGDATQALAALEEQIISAK